MNNLTRRLISLLCMLVLAFSLAVPAWAAEPAPDEALSPGEDAQAGSIAPAQPDSAAGETGGASESAGEPEAPTLNAAAPDAGDYAEIFVSADGSDEDGDGSREAPFASLARAAEAANADGAPVVYVCLLSDLVSTASARFGGKEIILTGEGERRTVTRGSGFAMARDALRGAYHPALVECGAPDGSLPGAVLSLENVVLDDAGLHEGRLYALPSAAAADESGPAPGEEDGAADAEGACVQSAILTVCSGSSATLASGSELRNFGGLSAVYAAAGSRFTAEAGSFIGDTVAVSSPEGLKAVLAEEGALLQIDAEAALRERSAQPVAPPAAPAAPEQEAPAEGDAEESAPGGEATEPTSPEAAPPHSAVLAVPLPADAAPTDPLPADAAPTVPLPADAALPDPLPTDVVLPGDSPLADREFSSLTLSAPESVTRLGDGVLRYEIPYDLSLSLTDSTVKLIEAVASVSQEAEARGSITLTLDERLSPLTGADGIEYRFESAVFAIETVSLESGNALVAAFRLRSDWRSHVGELSQPMRFSCTGLLPAAAFEENAFLRSTATAAMTLTVSGKPRELSSRQKEAATKMLPPESALLCYDANGGEGGPGTVPVSAQTGYALAGEPAPTHADENGKRVVFIGWTEARDTRLYAAGETAPATVEALDIETLKTYTVYAAWGYDENEDGIADVTQILVTLSYDANGGEGAPDPETKAAVADVGARFDISPVEPSRRYYTFQGWSKDPAATVADYQYNAVKKADRDLLLLHDTTLYAVWKPNPSYTLYYNANGGTGAPAAQTAISENNMVQMTITSAVPSRAGYRFLGWAATRRGSAEYFAGDEVRITNGSTMLYAVWAKNGGSYGGGSGSASPKTGDERAAALYGALALGSLLGCGLTWRRKRNPV